MTKFATFGRFRHYYNLSAAGAAPQNMPNIHITLAFTHMLVVSRLIDKVKDTGPFNSHCELGESCTTFADAVRLRLNDLVLALDF